MENREYDRFGPWVYEINEIDAMPPVFEKYYSIKEDPLMIFKIPVREERRNLRPGMHMYDFVIGLYESYLYIMDRVENTIIDRKINYEYIKALLNSVHLLEGKFVIYTASDKYEIYYNASSEKIINKAINIIREKQNCAGSLITNYDNSEFDDKLHVFFKNVLLDFSEDDKDFVPVFYQDKIKVKNKRFGLFKIILDFILRPELLPSMVLANGQEMILVARGDGFIYRNYPAYKKSFYYIPVKSIVSIDVEESVKFEKIFKIKINVGKNIIKIYVQNENRHFGSLLKMLS